MLPSDLLPRKTKLALKAIMAAIGKALNISVRITTERMLTECPKPCRGSPGADVGIYTGSSRLVLFVYGCAQYSRGTRGVLKGCSGRAGSGAGSVQHPVPAQGRAAQGDRDEPQVRFTLPAVPSEPKAVQSLPVYRAWGTHDRQWKLTRAWRATPRCCLLWLACYGA